MVKEVEAPKETYKQDDFFDSLSCEALERAGISDGSRPEKPQVWAPAKYKGCYMRDIMFVHPCTTCDVVVHCYLKNQFTTTIERWQVERDDLPQAPHWGTRTGYLIHKACFHGLIHHGAICTETAIFFQKARSRCHFVTRHNRMGTVQCQAMHFLAPTVEQLWVK